MENCHSQEIGLLQQAVQLSDHLLCLTAPNAGPMTGAGTNTYLINKADRYVVVDPGPNDDDHLDAILESVGGAGNIAMILVTHMHPDHSPAALPLSRLSGAPVYGWDPIDDEYQDPTCQPDVLVEHNQVIDFNGLRIRCIHTPGHVDNHVCYLLENDQVLMTGDHIMEGSTVVIIPPHGNMKCYIESLQLLNEYPIQALAPGHGELIDNPDEEINGIIQHRLMREAKVVNGLMQLTWGTLEQLTTVVYDDVDPSLHPIAQLSLLAHLLKLEQDNKAREQDGKWGLL